MKTEYFSKIVKRALLVFTLLVVPVAIPAIAQDSSSGSGSAQPAPSRSATSDSSTSRQSTTTTTQATQPVQTTVTRSTNTIDPLWLAIGGAAVIALIVIAFLAMRGGSTDTVSRVRERNTTVIKE
jgi:hypothetical protein